MGMRTVIVQRFWLASNTKLKRSVRRSQRIERTRYTIIRDFLWFDNHAPGGARTDTCPREVDRVGCVKCIEKWLGETKKTSLWSVAWEVTSMFCGSALALDSAKIIRKCSRNKYQIVGVWDCAAIIADNRT